MAARRSGCDADDGNEPRPAKKKRLARDCKLDPSDPHFAIQLDEDGDVVVLSDDSEVSSLHEDEIAFLRTNYEKARRIILSAKVVSLKRNRILNKSR